MRLKNFLSCLLLCLVFANTNAQQPVTVSGSVMNQNGDPLQGATVEETSTTKTTVTDQQGLFKLLVSSPTATLKISYIGYIASVIPLKNQTTIHIVLQESASTLGNVVVVGYGTQLKKDLTGSVSHLSSAKLLDKPAFDLAEAIGGKVAGVKIIVAGGAPGSSAMIRIRGTNSINTNNVPLFVVDGIVGVANALNILNPNEIQSLDVLKDASATAIYGARGSNGVIIITTKRGIAGKTQVEYNGYVTRNVMNRHIYALNADQFMYVFTQAWMNVNKYATSPNWPATFDAKILPPGQGGNTYSEMPWLFEQTTDKGYNIPLVGADGNFYKPRFNTDWESETFKPSTSTNHQISIRGGTDKAKYGMFFGYSDENGLLLNSFFRRYTAKINSDVKVNKWFSISSDLSVNQSKNRTNDVSFFSGGMARAAIEAYPILPIKYPDDPAIYGAFAGRFAGNADYPAGETPHTPVAISDGVQEFANRSQITGDITLNFEITPDLSFKSNFAVDANFYKYNRYASRDIDQGSQGTANINTTNSFYWQNENYLNYQKNIGDHSITGLLGLSWSQYNWENLGTSNNHFFDDFYGWHNIGIGSAPRPVPSSSDGMNALNSYFGRANYSYKDKYLLTVTGRIDGSSKFGANSKYGFFPSGSLAWKVTEEEFAKNITALSNLKLRVGVGKTGNQEIGSYVTQTFIGSGNVVLGGAVQPGLWPNSVGNSDLKWEKTTQYDGGVDIGLLEDRISITVDYYHKLTEDMLLNVPLPQSTTTGSVTKNYGTIENKGWEVSISTHNIASKNFNWYSDIAWSANKNKIIRLGPTGADILRNSWVGGANTILRVGESIGSFFGLDRLGTYSTKEASLAARYGLVPGDTKYLDRNGDGLINFVSDGTILGNGFPKWDLNFSNTFSYKNFDLNLDIRASYGARMENRTNHSGQDRQAMANGKNSILNAWRPDHQNTDQAQVRPGNGGAYYQTYPDTHWIEDASYIRGDGVTLGYTIPKSILGGISKFRVYASSKNFFVNTKYTGYDPEGSDNDNAGDPLTPGMDFFMYPRPTTYTLGINVIL